MISGGILTLPTSWRSAANSARWLERGELHPVGDPEDELDDVAAVRARVLVVGFDDVAEQHRRAAIRVPELERVVDAHLALAREELEQPDEWENEEYAPDATGRGDRDDEPDRGERGIDEERDAHRAHVLEDGDAEGGS
jgi:hypothetical protein